jgi:8-oxo-dGTP pyrophosphatase MutT (NUDIX family)
MRITLTEEVISEKLQRAYQPGVIASTDGYAEMYSGVALKCAAVLIGLTRKDGEWHLLYTRRTDTVEHHKGQVSFPGGGCDLGESTPEQTALREAEEEVGLKPGDVRTLGRMNDVITITRYRVTPVAGVFPWPYRFRPEPDEVVRVFTIPLEWLCRREHWDEEIVTRLEFEHPFPVITYHAYDGEILWGATARMTHNFLTVLDLLKK